MKTARRLPGLAFSLLFWKLAALEKPAIPGPPQALANKTPVLQEIGAGILCLSETSCTAAVQRDEQRLLKDLVMIPFTNLVGCKKRGSKCTASTFVSL